MVIIDKGRDIDERSAIYVENGVFKGIGFFNLNCFLFQDLKEEKFQDPKYDMNVRNR